MSGKVKRYIAVSLFNYDEQWIKEDRNAIAVVLSEDYDRLLSIARELAEQLSIAAHFVDAVSPWDMPVGWNHVVAQADNALAKAREEGVME